LFGLAPLYKPVFHKITFLPENALDAFLRGTMEAFQSPTKARHQWLMPVILATQEAEIRRIMIQGK
jgi:hypothetical protein